MAPRYFLAALFFLSACATSHEFDPTGGLGTEHRRLRVGSATFAFDPAAAAPLRVVNVEKNRASVMAQVSLSGPGVWDAATERLSADVRVTNTGAVPFDEPDLVITSITEVGAPDAGTPPATVRVELFDFDGDRVGSLFRFADLDASGGINGGSARHGLRFHSPGGVPFNFTVDVFAYANAPAEDIHPDGDDDGYNTESGQVRGDDCDDTDPAIRPGAGGCLCLDDCSVCGGGGCCETACQGACACPAGCDCDFTPDTGGGTDVGCTGSTCNLACTAAGGGTCQVSTCTDSSCALACEQTASLCRVGSCVGSTCDVRCEGNEGKCAIDSCVDSTCSLSCTDAEAKCSIDSCAAGSSCSLHCESTGSSCKLTCAAGAACVVTCVDAANCQLDCEGGSPVDCGGGVKACAAADCP